MPLPTRAKPDDSLKEHFITKDGMLWWNPELKEKHHRRNITKPIGLGRKQKFPTVCVEGEKYHVHRLNYWLHTGDWPRVLDLIDDDKSSLHIDNIKESTYNVIRATAKINHNLTYMIIRKAKKNGDIRYSSRIALNGKTKVVGTYDTEQEAIEAAQAVRWFLYSTGDKPAFLKESLSTIN